MPSLLLTLLSILRVPRRPGVLLVHQALHWQHLTERRAYPRSCGFHRQDRVVWARTEIGVSSAAVSAATLQSAVASPLDPRLLLPALDAVLRLARLRFGPPASAPARAEMATGWYPRAR